MEESEGWVTDIHPGYKTRFIKTQNATIEINRPILAPEEQARREARVIEVMKAVGKELNNGSQDI